MKKISLATAALALTASLGAYAAVPTDAQPFQVVVPNLKSGLEVTLEGLLLRPSNSDLDYAATDTLGFVINPVVPSIAFTNPKNVNSIDPGYNFGFRIGLGYIFQDSGNDVQLNWTHFDQSDDDNVTAGPGQFLVTKFGLILPNLTNFGIPSTLTASGNVDSKLDAIDLDVGQYLDVGTRLRMRLFGGLRFARVESNVSDFYSAAYQVPTLPPTNILFTESDNLNSKFSGVGPRFGVDTSYHIGNCFGIVAHIAGALLVGSTDTDTQQNWALAVNTVPGTVFTSQLNTDSDNTTRVVPAFDAKLGLDYTYIFANQSQLSLEAGYQWTQYIDAVDRLNNSLVDGVVGLGTVTRTTSSVGFDGPYLTLNWKV